MSWCEPLRRAALPRAVLPRAALPWAVMAFALWLGACGFEPLYARDEASGTGAQDQLAQVRIAPIPDRIGQELHNLLRDRLNPKGQPRKPDYNLQITLSEQTEELGIRKDETATRANLKVFANFVLFDARTNQTLLIGRSRSFNSYNILESQFATLFSEADARSRALREISDEIRNRLAVYFSRIAKRPS